METEQLKKEINCFMKCCTLCPRMCAVDRTQGKIGYCGMTDEVVVARAALHMWEEPCISGEQGSGTVFFSGCNMGCIYCQNSAISRCHAQLSENRGKKIDITRISDIFLELEQQGAHNINLVTPTHYIPQLVAAIRRAKTKGLSIPIVYNTSGYERVESLKLLDGLVDIYLPDFKYMDKERAQRYSMAQDYPVVVKKALQEMYRQVGMVVINENTGLLQKGVIVRHLVLPDTNRDTKQILRYLKETYGDKIYVSLMYQYTPMEGQLESYPELDMRVSDAQYGRCVDFAEKLAMANVYIQEGSVATESFIPSFLGEGV